MQRWKIPGASVAIARQGKLVYARSFGYADLQRTVPMQPYNLLRVASISKPVTAVAIMKLVESGQISLDHKAFGPNGYLNSPYYSSVITDKRIYNITVRNLLEHSAGWNREVACDGYGSSDPIDFPLHVAKVLHVPNPVGDSTLVRFLLAKGLNFTPGARFAYSNIGYLVLGKIIESVTGQHYEAWVRSNLLTPSGVQEAHLGHNLLADKLERESEYFSETRSRSCYGTRKDVQTPYGGCNLEAMNAHGGWVFSARDLVRFVLAVDGSPTRPDLLGPGTIDTMTQASAAQRHYAKGWMVNKNNTWWHTGSLDGTASCVVRTSAGYTWAILLNGRGPSNRFWNDLEDLGWDCINGSNAWPTHDLFAPELNATRLAAVPAGPQAVTLTWASGSGTRRLVVMKEGSPVDAFPLDGVAYTAKGSFSSGDTLGRGNFVVADAAGASTTVSHLTPGKTYYARVIEYYQNESTDNQPVYSLDGNPTLSLRLAVPKVVAAKPARTSIRKTVATRFSSKTPVHKPAPAAPRPAEPVLETSVAPPPTHYLTRLREILRKFTGV
ncbi:serine hydrolase domain-containing protein [Hymenobacter jejuensis]|uniref:Beta-lactamase family protein n=1 Tax=Hymenobacter jejuensis TaxID=2502781 RepID=A0A5B8A0A1_9BACT|nr:serine hydrolase domain-containing protein [Hymenobacter jejuensis]QDA60226.1 beta-lactamase family protein [Hymenobacter jejuensis]